MKEKLRQLFGGDQKQDKTKEVAEQKEQIAREEQEELKEEENTDNGEFNIIIEEDDAEWEDDGWSRKLREKKAESGFEYTARDYEELKIRLYEAEDEITDLEGQIHDLMVECRQVDKLLTQTHMELNDEIKKRKKAEETARAAQRAVSELERIKTILGLGAENAAETAQGLVEELERIRSVLDSKDEAIASLEARHGNMLRMSKERANADRNLRPKKWHTGYPVIRSTQKKIKNEIVWETLIQTHYHFDLAAEAADEEIQRDLFTEKGLIYNLGITDQYEGPYESMKTEMRRKGKKVDELNVAFSCRLERDFQGKYWKVWIMHTKPLGEIPDDMMLQDN